MSFYGVVTNSIIIVYDENPTGVAALVKRYGERRILVVALVLTTLLAGVEGMDISVQLWSFVLMPVSTVVHAVIRPCLSSLFVGGISAVCLHFSTV